MHFFFSYSTNNTVEGKTISKSGKPPPIFCKKTTTDTSHKIKLLKCSFSEKGLEQEKRGEKKEEEKKSNTEQIRASEQILF